jgi:hypothetical protein
MSDGPGRYFDPAKMPGLVDILNNKMGLRPGFYDLQK